MDGGTGGGNVRKKAQNVWEIVERYYLLWSERTQHIEEDPIRGAMNFNRYFQTRMIAILKMNNYEYS